MPSWGAILREITDLESKQAGNALDLVRRKYLASQHTHSKRALIVYASKWTQPGDGIPPGLLSIDQNDIQGYMECIHGVKESELDLVLHSPGGSLFAAEACVDYLRSKFNHIRVFVPHAAMSAATMIACAADEIVMGKHSSLGPIDPQFIMQTSLGARSIPAQAILDQFEKAKAECADPKKLAVWLPMLQQYGPDLLIQCENVSALSQELVRKWLTSYMFKGQADGDKKATAIAEWLASHREFKTHSRPLNRNVLRERGLKIVDLENDKLQQDFVLSIYHALTHTFTKSSAVKIIENHQGSAFIQQVGQFVVQGQAHAPAVPAAPTQKKKP